MESEGCGQFITHCLYCSWALLTLLHCSNVLPTGDSSLWPTPTQILPPGYSWTTGVWVPSRSRLLHWFLPQGYNFALSMPKLTGAFGPTTLFSYWFFKCNRHEWSLEPVARVTTDPQTGVTFGHYESAIFEGCKVNSNTKQNFPAVTLPCLKCHLSTCEHYHMHKLASEEIKYFVL